MFIFTCIMVIFVLYFLHQDGIIFVMMLALIAELANLLMLRVMTKSAEKKIKKKFFKIVNDYKTKITAYKKTIQEFEGLQKELDNANLQIKKYEQDIKKKNNLEIDGTEAKKTQNLKELQNSEMLQSREEKKTEFKKLLTSTSSSKEEIRQDQNV